MNTQSNLKSYFPLFLLTIILIFGIYYYTNNHIQSDTNNTTTNDSIDKQDNEKLFNIVLDENDTTNIQGENNNKLSKEDDDTYTYQLEISEIRNPVNSSLYDLMDKAKYQNKFTQQDVLDAIVNSKNTTQSAIYKINQLNYGDKFDFYTDRHRKSLEYIIKAIDALEKYYSTEEIKYIDEFNLNIEYSNREVVNLKY
jgi:hypothetical protein